MDGCCCWLIGAGSLARGTLNKAQAVGGPPIWLEADTKVERSAVFDRFVDSSLGVFGRACFDFDCSVGFHSYAYCYFIWDH